LTGSGWIKAGIQADKWWPPSLFSLFPVQRAWSDPAREWSCRVGLRVESNFLPLLLPPLLLPPPPLSSASIARRLARMAIKRIHDRMNSLAIELRSRLRLAGGIAWSSLSSPLFSLSLLLRKRSARHSTRLNTPQLARNFLLQGTMVRTKAFVIVAFFFFLFFLSVADRWLILRGLSHVPLVATAYAKAESRDRAASLPLLFLFSPSHTLANDKTNPYGSP